LSELEEGDDETNPWVLGSSGGWQTHTVDGREGQYSSVATRGMVFFLALEKTWKPHLWRQHLASQIASKVLKPR